MFAFGFGAMIVLTQMYGLGLSVRLRRLIGAAFIVLTFGAYAIMGRLEDIHEILRISLLDYLVVFLLYGIFQAVLWMTKLFRQPVLTGTLAE